MPLEYDDVIDDAAAIAVDNDAISPSTNVLNHDINVLRVSLIGNKDLKFKLIRDLAFVNELVNDFEIHVSQLISKSPADLFNPTNQNFIDDLKTKMVIFKILSTFVNEIDFKQSLSIIDSINQFDRLIKPIYSLASYHISHFVPYFYTQSSSSEVISKFECIIGFGLDIFIVLNNAKEFNFEFDDESSINELWKFVISLVILSDNNKFKGKQSGLSSSPSLISYPFLTKTLNLTPFIIANSRDNQFTTTLMVTLLSALLKRLDNECNKICEFHFPNSNTDSLKTTSNYFNELCFKDYYLPNIEPNNGFFKSKINVQFLIELITCTAQIFSHLRSNNKNVVMTIPNNGQGQDKFQHDGDDEVVDVDETQEFELQNDNLHHQNNKNVDNDENDTSPIVVLPIRVYLSLLLTLKYDNKLLNLVSLNLIHLYLDNLMRSSNRPSRHIKNEVLKSYKKLFPRIIDLLDLDSDSNVFKPLRIPKYLESATKILCTISLSCRFARDEIRRCNIDHKIMNYLSKLIKSDTSLKNMNILKKASMNGKNLVDFTNLIDLENYQKNLNNNINKNNLIDERNKDELSIKKNSPKKDQLAIVGDYFLLLSIYVGDKEEYRYRIVEYKPQNNSRNLLAQLTFELIDNYRFLLMQTQIIYKILRNKNGSKISNTKDKIWFGKNLGMILSLIGNEVYFCVFHLIRSLSRSISTLRTFFVECNSFTSLLDLSDDSNEESGNVTNIGINDNDTNGHDSTTTISATAAAEAAATTTTNNITISSHLRYNRETGLPINGSFISNILHILRINEDLYKIIQFFCEFDYKLNGDYRKLLTLTNPLNKSIILGLIANFVLDFSSFRYDVVNDVYFLKTLSKIYENSINDEVNSTERNESLQFNSIQLVVLQILKNYSFNENQENKKELLEFIPISIVFDKSIYGLTKNVSLDEEIKELKLKQKIVAFDILRNLTAGSLYFSEKIKGLYQDYYNSNHFNNSLPREWDEYLISNMLNFECFIKGFNTSKQTIQSKLSMFKEDDDFLAKLMLNENYVKFITSINYIEDHRITKVSNFKQSDFPLENLLKIWERFLSLRISSKLEKKLAKNDSNSRIELNNNLNEIRLSIVWILINLTYKGNEYTYDYQFPDINHSRLHDIVLKDGNIEMVHSQNRENQSNNSRHGSVSANSYRIVIDDSDDEENTDTNTNNNHNNEMKTETNEILQQNHETSDENKYDSNKILTSVQKAKILYKFGFSDVLDNLYLDLDFKGPTSRRNSSLGSSKKDTNLKSNLSISIKKFDEVSSRGLLEKVKTANYQIISLITEEINNNSKHFEGSVGGEVNRNNNLADPHIEQNESHRIRRRSSNVITTSGGPSSARLTNRRPIIYSGTVGGDDGDGTQDPTRSTVRRGDVNRGGEGFGYGSDENYGGNEENRNSLSSQDNHLAETSEEDDDDDEDIDNNEDEEDDEIEDAYDDFWIR